MCTKLGSFMVFVNCMSMEQGDYRVVKLSLAGNECLKKLKLVIGGNSCKNFDGRAVQGNCELCCVGSDASSPRSAVLARGGQFELVAF